MPWVRIDDHFDEHPKFARAGPLGIAMWVAGLAYCNRNLTDGFIPWAVARRLLNWEFLGPELDDPRGRTIHKISISSGMRGEDVTCSYVVDLLIDAGLWEERGDGYQVHDYGDYQPSKEETIGQRDELSSVRAAAGRVGGLRSGETRRRTGAEGSSYINETSPKQNESKPEATDIAKQEANPKQNGSPVPGPVPGPGPENSVESHDSTAALARPPVLSFADFSAALRGVPANKAAAVLVDAMKAVYGVESKEFSRIAKLVNQHGAGELLKLTFSLVGTWNGVDNPLDYIQATAAAKSNDRRNGSRAVDRSELAGGVDYVALYNAKRQRELEDPNSVSSRFEASRQSHNV